MFDRFLDGFGYKNPLLIKYLFLYLSAAKNSNMKQLLKIGGKEAEQFFSTPYQSKPDGNQSMWYI